MYVSYCGTSEARCFLVCKVIKIQDSLFLTYVVIHLQHVMEYTQEFGVKVGVISQYVIYQSLLLLHPFSVHNTFFFFSLKVGPILVVEPKPVTVDIDSDVTLNCKWAGNPPLTLTWTKKGSSMVSSATRATLSTVVFLSFHFLIWLCYEDMRPTFTDTRLSFLKIFFSFTAKTNKKQNIKQNVSSTFNKSTMNQ